MRACRTWEVVKTEDGWRLKGNYNHIWPTTYVKADPPPSPDNTYGIYAYAELKHFYHPFTPSSHSLFGYDAVLSGIIETGGKEIIHEDGRIRAEYCSIICLFYDNRTDKTKISSLQEHYKVPFYDYQEFIGIALELFLSKLTEAQEMSGVQVTEIPAAPQQYSECVPCQPNEPLVRSWPISVAMNPQWLTQIIKAATPQNKFWP